MKLTLLQKLSIATGIVVGVLAGLYPPWTAKLTLGNYSPQGIFAGFFFIFRPPQGLDLAKQLFPELVGKSPSFLSGSISKLVTYEVNLKLLLIEWAVIGFVTIVAAAVFRGRSE